MDEVQRYSPARSDPRKYLTCFKYDAVNRATGQEDNAVDGSPLYAQTTTYQDVTREVQHVSRAGQTTLSTRYDRANRRTDEWQQLAAQPRLPSGSQVAGLQAMVTPDAGFTTGTLHWQVVCG